MPDAEIHHHTASTNNTTTDTPATKSAGLPLRLKIDNWLTKHSEDVAKAYEARYEKIAAASATVSRRKYRDLLAAAGKTVRAHVFHDHEPQKPNETKAAFERRINRYRMVFRIRCRT